MRCPTRRKWGREVPSEKLTSSAISGFQAPEKFGDSAGIEILRHMLSVAPVWCRLACVQVIAGLLFCDSSPVLLGEFFRKFSIVLINRSITLA